MRITTVIPSHGRRKTLAKAIESAINAGADEVFCLDTIGDVAAKTDPGNILSSWSCEAFKGVVLGPDRGMAGNWNQCFDIGTGEWLHILHDDDRIDPPFYKTLRAFESTPATTPVAYATGYINTTNEFATFHQSYSFLGVSKGIVPQNKMMECLTPGNIFRPSAVVMRRNVAKRFPFVEVGANDWIMWLRLATQGLWLIDNTLLAVMTDDGQNDGERIGARGRHEAILRTIEYVEGWLTHPWSMLRARDQASRFAALDGLMDVADKLSLRRR